MRAPVAIAGTPLTRLWQTRAPRGPTAPIAVDSISAYVGGADHRIVAVDLGSGKPRWSRRFPGPIVGGLIRSGGVLYVATDRPNGRLHAIQTVSGNELWSTSTGYVAAPIARVGDRLILLNRDRQILAIDTAQGRVLWRRPMPSQAIGPEPMGEGVVLVTSYDSLYLVRVRDGSIALRRRAPGTVVSPWIRVGDRMIAGTGDSLVVSITTDSLRPAWRARVDGPLLTSPVARGDTLYCVTQFGSLYRILPGETPEVTRLRDARWAVTGQPTLFGPWLLVGGSEGALRAFRLSDGSEEWSAEFGRPLELAPLLLGDSGFVALGGQGDMHRMRM